MQRMDDQTLRALLARAQGTPSPAGEPEDAADFDWAVPHRFTESQVKTLQSRLAVLETRLGKQLTKLLRDELAVRLGTPRFAFADNIEQALPEMPCDYLLLMLRNGQPGGVLAFSREQAMTWITQLLGGSVQGQAGAKKLTELEADLQGEIFRAVTQAVSDVLAEQVGLSLAPAGDISAKLASLMPDHVDDYVVIDFSAVEAEDESEQDEQESSEADEAAQDAPVIGALMLAGPFVEWAVTGKPVPAQISPEEAQQTMRMHVEHVHVPVQVDLGQAELLVSEVMSLSAGDVVLLDRRVDAPAEVHVQGKTVLYGFPVTCEGEYALQISSDAAQ